MNIGFTPQGQNVLNRAVIFASGMGHKCVGTEHLIAGLLSVSDGACAKLFSENGIDLKKYTDALEESLGRGPQTKLGISDFTQRTRHVLEVAAQAAVQSGKKAIGAEFILYAVLNERDSYAVKLLDTLGCDTEKMRKDLESSISQASESGDDGDSGEHRKNADASLKDTPTIADYGRNLCQMAKEGKIDPIIGRDTETDRVIQILSRRTKNNPCLIGEPGVGKTAVVEGLAQRIADGNVPDTLNGKIIVTLDISGMIAGAKYRGEFEERMKKVMDESRRHPEIILFIDEIHTIIGAGGAEGAVDAANIIKPALARGEMQMIGATTIDEYRKHIEKDAALERRFQSVMVGEPTVEEAIEIIKGLREKYETFHKLKITDGAVESAVKLSVRYIGDRFLPDKAIDLIDEASSKKHLEGSTPDDEYGKTDAELKRVTLEKENAIKNEDYEGAAKLRDEIKSLTEKLDSLRSSGAKDGAEKVVTEDDIAEIVTSWTGIPVKKLADEEGQRLLLLDSILKDRVIGQDDAVDAVARAIRRGRMGLKDPKRPIGSFIFLGPTGVGKTELTKQLADVMFGDVNAMIRIDMSEYMEKHSVSKLIGSPPGYVGYDEGGQLTEKIRRHPYSVVLFDEIEKAHPDVFNILLQILEDGILTDSQGRTVDFKNTVIIMTSNAGATQTMTAPKTLGFLASGGDKMSKDESNAKNTMMEALKTSFKPEFINRVDEIIIFNRLTQKDIEKITSIMLREVTKRINALDIEITFSDEVISSLAEAGFDPVYGARPLRRAIVRRVEDSFSEAMLRGDVKSGDKIEAVLTDGKIEYRKAHDNIEAEKVNTDSESETKNETDTDTKAE